MLIKIMICASIVEFRLADISEETLNPLVQTLRRQLMENNYDYQSRERAEDAKRARNSLGGRFSVVRGNGTRPRDRRGRRDAPNHALNNKPFNITHNEQNNRSSYAPQYESDPFKIHNTEVGLDANNLREWKGPLFRSGANTIYHQQPQHAVSKNDLLYYLDDNRLRRSNDAPGGDDDSRPDIRLQGNDTERSDNSVQDDSTRSDNALRSEDTLHRDDTVRSDTLPPEDTPQHHELQHFAAQYADAQRHKDVDYEEMYPQDEETTTPVIKYKLLKVMERHPTRRSQPVRRFLEERGAKGLAFIKLDDEPFPEFTLPRSRRQYMRDAGEDLRATDSDQELSLPEGSQRQDLD